MKIENKIVWMNIPVAKLERASIFYDHLMRFDFIIEEANSTKFALYFH